MNRMIKVSKKDKSTLKSAKCIVQKPSDFLPEVSDNIFGIYFSLTKGELLALKDALECHPTMVGEDVKAYLNNALEEANVNLGF